MNNTRNIVNIFIVALLFAVSTFWGVAIFVYKRAQPLYDIAKEALSFVCFVSRAVLLYESYQDYKARKSEAED